MILQADALILRGIWFCRVGFTSVLVFFARAEAHATIVRSL